MVQEYVGPRLSIIVFRAGGREVREIPQVRARRFNMRVILACDLARIVCELYAPLWPHHFTPEMPRFYRSQG